MRKQDRRAWPRQPGFLRVLVLDPEDALEEPYGGWVVDYSKGGVCVAFRAPFLEEGGLVRLQPILAKPTVRYWVDVRVRNRRRNDTQTMFGCQFLGRSAWEWLQSVG